jgi:hypothetical protein
MTTLWGVPPTFTTHGGSSKHVSTTTTTNRRPPANIVYAPPWCSPWRAPAFYFLRRWEKLRWNTPDNTGLFMKAHRCWREHDPSMWCDRTCFFLLDSPLLDSFFFFFRIATRASRHCSSGLVCHYNDKKERNTHVAPNLVRPGFSRTGTIGKKYIVLGQDGTVWFAVAL